MKKMIRFEFQPLYNKMWHENLKNESKLADTHENMEFAGCIHINLVKFIKFLTYPLFSVEHTVFSLGFSFSFCSIYLLNPLAFEESLNKKKRRHLKRFCCLNRASSLRSKHNHHTWARKKHENARIFQNQWHSRAFKFQGFQNSRNSRAFKVMKMLTRLSKTAGEFTVSNF